jgi:hypothetical protein
LDGEHPSAETPEQWLELAQTVIDGDEAAIEAGYEAAVCPAADEVQAALHSAGKELADVSPAERELDRVQAAVISLRQQADDLILDIVEEVRFHARKEDPASQRHLLRNYGATFRYQPGEVRDLADVVDVADEEE